MNVDYETPVDRPSKKAVWTGRVLSALPVPLLLMSAAMQFLKPQQVIEGNAHVGWPMHLATPLGIVKLVCLVLYLIPQTAVLGAILLTGYLGGATATHLRVGDPWFVPVLMGVVLWLGLFLRDPRLRALIPFRRPQRLTVGTAGPVEPVATGAAKAA